MRWAAGILLFVAGCYLPAHTLNVAARREVMSTATCPNVEIDHVPWTDVAGQREDVYVAEGCGNRWRMTCEMHHVTVCPKHAHNCHVEQQWSCDNVQPEDLETSEDDLRARVTHPNDMNILGS